MLSFLAATLQLVSSAHFVDDFYPSEDEDLAPEDLLSRGAPNGLGQRVLVLLRALDREGSTWGCKAYSLGLRPTFGSLGLVLLMV